MKGLRVWIAACFLSVAWSPSLAQCQESLFLEGNALYEAEDYEGAASKYGQALAQGVQSSSVYYNLGNAEYQSSRPARAVLAWERALKLDPGHGDARANLELVRGQLQDRIEPLPEFWLVSLWSRWTRALPRTVLLAATGSAWMLLGAAGVLLILGRPPGARRLLRRTAWSLGAACLIFGGTLILRESGWGSAPHAVILSDEVRVLAAPSDAGGLTLFTIHAGTKVRVDESRAEWSEVVLADGRVGWIPTASMEMI